MAIQSTFKAGFTALRKSFGRDKKQTPVLNKIHDAFNALGKDALPAAELVEHTTRLAQALSEGIPLLHKSRVRPTLAFCGSAIAWLCEAKHEPAAKSGDKESAAIWEEAILNGLIQPILDICDSGIEDAGVFGETVYPAICKAMRASCAAAFGGRFARSADDSQSKLALVLACSCSAPENKSVLLEQDVFGVSTLSKLIIDAKDYHHLDTLLELSFNMFSSQNGTNSRKDYAEALFNSEYATSRLSQEVRAELVRIHEVTKGSNSEKHVLDIIRTMSSAQVQRPQVFSTQRVSYCGANYMQRAPGSVAILDNNSISIIICDQDDETDVLTAPFTSIEKVELAAPDASRILVKFVVSEAPLIFSIRKAVETPTSHANGTPLCLGISISQSNVLDFEAALTARNLANKVTGDGIIARRASSINTKISRAVSGVGLPEPYKENPSQERVDEMMDKYVNMPSSPNPAPVVVEPKRPAPKKSTNVSSNHVAKMVPTPAPQARHVAKKPTQAPEVQSSSSTGRPRRACAAQAAKVIQKQALESPDELELSEPDVTPAQPRRTVTIQNPSGANGALPTPPDTRKTKPAGKILVPGSPAVAKAQLESPSSPISEIPSPTAKVASKRKRVEDDPIEPSVDVPERESEKAQKALPSSQYIVPRNTATTRAKAKYTTNAKKMRVSSPDPTDQVDAEGPSPLARANMGGELVRSGEEDSDSGEDVAEARPPSKENDPVIRSTATSKKPKVVAKAVCATSELGSSLRSPELDDLMQGTSELACKGHEATPTIQPGCPMDDERKQEMALLSEQTAETPTSPEQLSLNSNPIVTREEHVEESERGIGLIDVGTASMVDDAEVEVDNEAPSSQGKFLEPLHTVIQIIDVRATDDELLAALSRAAKKATRGCFLGSKAVQLCPTSPIEEFATSVGDRNVIDGCTTTAKDIEPDAPKSLAPPKKTQPKSTSPKVLPVRQPKSVKQEKALAEKQASPKVSLDVPQASKVRQPKESTQANKAISMDVPLDNTVHSGGQTTKGHAQPLSNGRSDKTTRRSIGASKDGYPTPQVQAVDTSEALESFTQSTNYKPNAAIGRIQETPAIETAPTARLPAETLSTRGPASGAPVILVDLAGMDSEEDEPLQAKVQPPVAKPVFRQTAQKAVFPNSIPARLKPQPEIALQAAAKIRPAHNVFERLIRSPQHGPKSALASPQKRTLPRAGRPSVSFVDTLSPIRRGSSDSSVAGRFKSEQRDARAKMLAGASVRTGSAIMQIVEVLDAIQTMVAENLSEKVQTVTNDARNARAELTRTVVAKLGAIQAQAEHHCDALREFEGVFATQTHEFLDGCNRIDNANTKINAQVQEVMAKNARAGQRIAKTIVDFELPEAVSMYLVSN